jgi:cation diffusion facilitator CzcD-associated flavoprotein CzcO
MAISVTTTAVQDFEQWVLALADAMTSADPTEFAALFADDGHWKDILAFTGDFRTFSRPEAIAAAWARRGVEVRPTSISVAKHRADARSVRRSGRNVIEGYFQFETVQGHAEGFARLLEPSGSERAKVWLLLTTLNSLHGHEEQIGKRRTTGVGHAHDFAGENWLDQRLAEQRFGDRDPEVLVVGAGQGGLILGARLRQMGVDALIVDKLPRVGDVWRRRYHSLTLHNEVWANSMPYMPFPDTWPTFVPKDMLADWLEAYAAALELNVWTSTELETARYDDEAGTWTILLRQGSGARTVRARHLVLAVGGSAGVPKLPELPGIEDFDGRVMHSSQFTSGRDHRGSRAIVVGTGNSGHDVAQDLYSNGAESVTMVQRGPTCVVSLVPSGTMVYSVYSEGPSPEDVDLLTAAIPYEVLRDTYRWLTARTCELDRELLDGLRSVGFELDYGEDDTGFHMMYLRHGGGYYIDVGCSELIAERKIRLVHLRDMERFVADGLMQPDGTVIDADLVVLATGYDNLQQGIARWMGEDAAERVGPIWGFDETHEGLRNMWRKTAQPGLWIMGGSFVDARPNSRYLAIQIVAELRDIVLPVL